MHQDDGGVRGKRLKSRAHRVHTLRATGHKAKTLAAKLAQPLGRPFGVSGRQHNHDLTYFGVSSEGAQRAQQHRHAEDGTKLLRLTGACPHPRPRRHDHDSDVRRRAGE